MQDAPLRINDYWRKIECTKSELHARPQIGLSETAESIGENAELIKQALTNMDTEEIIEELDGLQQLFFPLNSWNKDPVKKSNIKEICNRMADTDPKIRDRLVVLSNQM